MPYFLAVPAIGAAECALAIWVLSGKQRRLAAAAQTVTAGRNNMPPFRSTFTPEQIRDVSAYVVEALAGGEAR